MMDVEFKLNEENIIHSLTADNLNRNRYLNGLVNILNNITDSKIIALDGDWGSGKTWFLKSLEYLIEKQEYKKFPNIDKENIGKLKENYMTFYYDAWENDDASSAMLSLMYKLVNDSGLQKEPDETSFAIRALNAIIKYSTNGVVDLKEDFCSEKWTNKKITDEIQTSEEIKKYFKELIDNLLVENKNKILIIIDEIDRCKPTFAINLLESIKHFYNDERIVFIIGTNNKQLASLVKKVYGNEYDGASYLDKFFDINLELPNNYIETYMQLVDCTNLAKFGYLKYYNEIAKYYGLTMREYNRYINSLDLISKSFCDIDDDPYYIPAIIKSLFIPLALCLKIHNKDKYYTFIRGDLFDEINSLIRYSNDFENFSKYISKEIDKNIFKEFEQLEISNEVKKERELVKSINEIKLIYDRLFIECLKNVELYSYKKQLLNVLDIISMMK